MCTTSLSFSFSIAGVVPVDEAGPAEEEEEVGPRIRRRTNRRSVLLSVVLVDLSVTWNPPYTFDSFSGQYRWHFVYGVQGEKVNSWVSNGESKKEKKFQKKKERTKRTLPFSISFVSITITVEPCSQIICQKSAKV
jgi:hypothetical protein